MTHLVGSRAMWVGNLLRGLLLSGLLGETSLLLSTVALAVLGADPHSLAHTKPQPHCARGAAGFGPRRRFSAVKSLRAGSGHGDPGIVLRSCRFTACRVRSACHDEGEDRKSNR